MCRTCSARLLVKMQPSINSAEASPGVVAVLPRDLVLEHGVEDENQLAHGRDHDHLPGSVLKAHRSFSSPDLAAANNHCL